MKYDVAIVFKKLTNLMPYYYGIADKAISSGAIASFCAKERPVNLVLLIRYEYDRVAGKDHTFCKVKCPINPLPVKGEFEVPSVNAIEHFLSDAGWTKTDVMSKKLFE